MMRLKHLLLVTFCVSAIAGCDFLNVGNPNGGDGDMMIENDLEFIDFFVPHHVMAIEMAEMVVERGERAEVKALAQRIIDMQMMEIEQMRQAREELTGNPNSPPMQDPHMEMDMERMMEASGAALDVMFLEHMIPHHAGGVQKAHEALPHLQREDMRTLARNIEEEQSKEIEEMRILLGKGDTHARE